MAQSERDVKTKINSEIHASLRRLEDANHTSEVVQMERMSSLADQVAGLAERVDNLHSEVYEVHDLLEPHMMDGDLKFFDNAWIGNLQVDDGATFGGSVSFTGSSVTFEQSAIVNEGLDVYGSDGIFATRLQIPGGSTLYNFVPHKLFVNGTQIAGRILSTGDIDITTE